MTSFTQAIRGSALGSIVALTLRLCVIASSAHAVSLNFQPTTHYEINTSNAGTILIESTVMQIAHSISGAFQALAFWEYTVSDITDEFQTIDSASININRIINPVDRNNHAIQLVTYQADNLAPVLDDFSNTVAAPDTFQNAPLPEGINVFDFTVGLNTALQNNYSFFGVVAFVPSTINGILMDVEGVAELTVTGTLIPEPPILPPKPPSSNLAPFYFSVLDLQDWASLGDARKQPDQSPRSLISGGSHRAAVFLSNGP